MLKFTHFSFFLISITASIDALALCSWDPVPSVYNALIGKTVCATDAKEQHRAGDELWDYKHGPSHPKDPSDIVGSWVADTNNVTYTYTYKGTPTTYTYTLHHDSTTSNNDYTFCGPTDVDAKIITDFAGCP